MFYKLIGRERPTFQILLVSMASLVLASCTTIDKLGTHSVEKNSTSALAGMNAVELSAAERDAGIVYQENPKNPTFATRYAKILQMTGKSQQALAVMQQAAIHNPDNRSVLADYGKAQASAGNLQEALRTIERAQTPDRPDWRLLSAEGAVLDQLGHPDKARQRYQKALQIQPNEPSILSNMAMSYLLEDDLRTAESYLKQAIQQPGADSRVRQNLALVVGLQGRFDEAEQIASDELSEAQADANMAYLKAML